MGHAFPFPNLSGPVFPLLFLLFMLRPKSFAGARLVTSTNLSSSCRREAGGGGEVHTVGWGSPKNGAFFLPPGLWTCLRVSKRAHGILMFAAFLYGADGFLLCSLLCAAAAAPATLWSWHGRMAKSCCFRVVFLRIRRRCFCVFVSVPLQIWRETLQSGLSSGIRLCLFIFLFVQTPAYFTYIITSFRRLYMNPERLPRVICA